MIVVVLIVTLLLPSARKPEVITRTMTSEEECIAEAAKYLRAWDAKNMPEWTTYGVECRVTVEPKL